MKDKDNLQLRTLQTHWMQDLLCCLKPWRQDRGSKNGSIEGRRPSRPATKASRYHWWNEFSMHQWLSVWMFGAYSNREGAAWTCQDGREHTASASALSIQFHVFKRCSDGVSLRLSPCNDTKQHVAPTGCLQWGWSCHRLNECSILEGWR